MPAWRIEHERRQDADEYGQNGWCIRKRGKCTTGAPIRRSASGGGSSIRYEAGGAFRAGQYAPQGAGWTGRLRELVRSSQGPLGFQESRAPFGADDLPEVLDQQ